MYYAHKRELPDGKFARQTMWEHLNGTANRAAQCLRRIGLESTGRLTGLLHDMGKYSDDFQAYLESGDNGRRGSVIHSFQGCRYIMKMFHGTDAEPAFVMTAELIGFAVGAHHGLFDCIDATGRSGLLYRSEKRDVPYEEAAQRFFREFPAEELEKLFARASAEIAQVVKRIDEAYGDDREYAFEIGLLARLLLSAVIEGDRYDTAVFMGVAAPDIWQENMTLIWKERLDFLEEKLAHFPRNTAVASARHTFSELCRDFAAHEPGIFRLNIPTGGGKTLSSLRYALAHAMQFHKRRLIFVSPLLSILEQNAGVIREFVGDDNLILEHHSNIVRASSEQSDEFDRQELLLQSWNAPIVITTLVQLLNTLFAGKTAAIRRLQALCDSVIVIDEVQTVPTDMLTLFNLAIRFLSEQCGATVVLCSATQPELESAEHPLQSAPKQIVPRDDALWAVFRRTELCRLPDHRLDELPDLIRTQMQTTNSLLVVCNKKSEAAYLLERTKSPDYRSFHLSAAMCMQHRRDVLAAMQEALAKPSCGKVLCVATQVIEAGVDISFDTAMRLTAGLDSIVQTAGRCNRNGESETPRPVYVVNCSDEKLGMLRDIQRGKDASLSLMEAFAGAPERFGGDLFSDASIRYYYRAFYRDMAQEEQDFYIPQEKATLLDLAGANEAFAGDTRADAASLFLRQAFKTAGQHFSVFDEDTVDVIVPYGKGRELAAELCSERCRFDLAYRAAVLRGAAAYSVGICQHQKERLERQHALLSICDDSAWILADGFYDNTVGLTENGPTQTFMEV